MCAQCRSLYLCTETAFKSNTAEQRSSRQDLMALEIFNHPLVSKKWHGKVPLPMAKLSLSGKARRETHQLKPRQQYC